MATTPETAPKAEPRTWTFEPDDDVRSLISKATTAAVGKKNADKKAARGLRTKFINEAIRLTYAPKFGGKREAGK